MEPLFGLTGAVGLTAVVAIQMDDAVARVDEFPMSISLKITVFDDPSVTFASVTGEP
jgi:hypothetical protein